MGQEDTFDRVASVAVPATGRHHGRADLDCQVDRVHRVVHHDPAFPVRQEAQLGIDSLQ